MSIKFKKILIDYGHGGLEPQTGRSLTSGKQYTFPDGLTVYEGDINRKIAVALAPRLQAMGYQTFDVVAGVEWRPGVVPSPTLPNIALSVRVQNANRYSKAGDAFLLSIHCNATGNALSGPSQPTRGVAFFTSPGKTRSDEVATALHAAFSKRFAGTEVRMLKGDWADGDVDYEAEFFVLQRSRCAAVLGETLFFTNRQDAEYLLSAEGPANLAAAYAEGLRSFVDLSL